MDNLPSHIIFNKEYLTLINGKIRNEHETWFLNAEPEEYEFGGNFEGKDWNNLIYFHKIPDALGIKSVDKLRLGINFELFFHAQIDGKILSYIHDEHGNPTLLTQDINVDSENPYSNFPLVETKVRLAKTPVKWLIQDWCGNCNKIGGNPIWVQEPILVNCPCCGDEMIFILQLDSGLPDDNARNANQIMFGNDGMCYAFWCDKDRVSSFIWQCT